MGWLVRGESSFVWLGEIGPWGVAAFLFLPNAGIRAVVALCSAHMQSMTKRIYDCDFFLRLKIRVFMCEGNPYVEGAHENQKKVPSPWNKRSRRLKLPGIELHPVLEEHCVLLVTEHVLAFAPSPTQPVF